MINYEAKVNNNKYIMVEKRSNQQKINNKNFSF